MEELMHWFLNGETHCIYPENIPEHVDSKDSSEDDEEWDFYYEDDEEHEIGFDPYLGCYTDDC